MLDGKKTYLVGAILALMSILYGIEVIGLESFITIAGVLLGGGLITTRIAVKNEKIPAPLVK